MLRQEIDSSEVFGHMLVCRHAHEPQFHFDLRKFDLEKVRAVLEANGYTVEPQPADRSWILAQKGSQEGAGPKRPDGCYFYMAS